MKFKSDIEVQAGIKDSAGNPGTTGQVLSSNGTTVSWVDGDSDTAHTVLNQVKAGVAINKGQAVYVTSADGTNIIVGLASNTSEATSSKTLGLLDATVAINGFANVVQIGRLAGLNTIGATVGDPVWLGQNGNLIYGLLNKPYAPEHLVFIGIVTRVNSNNGEIFVNVQNGFELNEIHDVDIKTNVPINGDILGYDGTLWVNKTVAEWLGYTPVPDTRTITINGITQDLSADQTWTVEGGIGGSGTVDTLPKFTAATVVGDSQIKDSGTNVSIGYPVNPDIYKVDIAGTFRNSIPSLTGGQTIISAIDGGSNAYSIDIDINDNITHLWSTGFGTTSMFINPNGFVSIGGTSSLARFNVLGNMFAGSMLFNNANISALSGLNFSVSTNSLERMRIFSSGNVFIGSSPVDAGYKLDVNGKLNVRDGLTGYLSGLNSYRTYTAAAQFQISSYQSKGTANYTKTMDIVANSDNGADSEIRFLTKAYYATEPQEQMRIDRFGSVSIGNTTGYTGFGLLNVSNNSYLNEIWTQEGLWFGSFSEGAANTFIYGEGANTGGQFLDFGVNFSTRIRIFDGGNVGIGVLTDAGYKLDVNGGVKINGLAGIGTRTVVADANGVLSTTTGGTVTGSGAVGQVAYWDGTTSITGESNLFWDSTNDRLGIGTAIPSRKLHVSATGNNGIYIQTTNEAQITMSGYDSTNSIYYCGYDGTGLYYQPPATQINKGSSTGITFPINYYSGGDNGNNSYLSLQTQASEKMRITSSGNVGIGTGTPSSPLEIKNTGAVGGGTSMYIATYSTAKQWGTRTYGIDNTTGIHWSTDVQFSSTWHSAIRIGHGQNAGNPSLQTYFGTQLATSSGNVLIGTTTDSGDKLQVGGLSGGVATPTAIRMDGTYRTGGDAFDKLKFYLYKDSVESYGLGLGDLADLQYWAGGTSTGQHRFFTKRTERMRITDNGDVGIGVDSTSSYKLYVAGGQYGTYLRGGDLGIGSAALNVVKADNSSALYVRGDGNVGINEIAPNSKLTIKDGIKGIGSKGTFAIENDSFFKSLYMGVSNFGQFNPFIQASNRNDMSPTNLLINANGGNVGIGIGTANLRSVLQIDSSTWAYTGATVSRMLQKNVGSAADYEQHVILLHPIYNGTLIGYNKCSGTIYATRGGVGNGLINDTYHLDTASAYNSFNGTINSTIGYGRLATCLYGGVKYMALLPDYRTSAVEYDFDGYIKSTQEELRVVVYRMSNTGTVINSEINNSLAIYTPGVTLYQGDLRSTSSLFADTSVCITNGGASPVTRLNLGGYAGTRLPYINDTTYSFDNGGITVGSGTTNTSNKAGGLDLTNNTYSIGAYSPIISFSSLSANGIYNNSYAGIWGVNAGQGSDANWLKGDLVFGTAPANGIKERMRIYSNGDIAKLTTSGIDGNFDNVIKYGYFGDLNSGSSNTNRWIGIDATVTAGAAITNALRIRAYGGGTGNAAPVNIVDFRGDLSTLFYGNVTAAGFFNSSDIRLKEIVPYEYSISDIKPISYLWKDLRDNKKHVGYSAQEVQKVMPDAVNEGEDGMLSVNYIEVLVAKIAELENRIKQLEK